MNTIPALDEADAALKSKHRTMWGLGSYASVARDLVRPLGPALVEAAGIRSGDRVADVAAGTGNAAIEAARRGARVVASDLSPLLLDEGRAIAERESVDLAWVEADAEALPFRDGEFDATISSIGVMFAPHHERAAAELVRVTRRGGTIGLLNWTPEGFVGRLFAVMRPFLPVPPPGVQAPPLWGMPSHLRMLLGDRVELLRTETRRLRVDLFPGASDFREYFAANYGPTISAYRWNEGDPERIAQLDRALDELAADFRTADGSMEWEYLVAVGRVR